MTNLESWYTRVRKNHISPFMDKIADNLPAIAVATSLLAVGVAVRTTMDTTDELTASVEKNNQLLSIIEEKIATAIEAPTIVKVELGDDIELFGLGDRVS